MITILQKPNFGGAARGFAACNPG